LGAWIEQDVVRTVVAVNEHGVRLVLIFQVSERWVDRVDAAQHMTACSQYLLSEPSVD
jgi:hypothetical protein